MDTDIAKLWDELRKGSDWMLVPGMCMYLAQVHRRLLESKEGQKKVAHALKQAGIGEKYRADILRQLYTQVLVAFPAGVGKIFFAQYYINACNKAEELLRELADEGYFN